MSQIPKPQGPSPKRVIVRDEGYRRHIATQPCMGCRGPESDADVAISQAAHVSVGNFARGMKADDSLCIPLCADRPNGEQGCHSVFDKGQESFCLYYLRMTIDELKAQCRANYAAWKRLEES